MSQALLSLFRFRGFDNPSANLFQQWVSEDKCPACGAGIQKKSPASAAIWVGSGSRWTDIISNIDGVLLHERVIETITRERLCGFNAHRVVIEKIDGKKLPTLPTPQYYLLEITGQVDIDWSELDDVGGCVCPICFARHPAENNPYRWREKRILPRIQTWDESDFLKLRNLRSGIKICSKRFVDLACKHKWTNFVFGESLPGVGLWEKPQRAINGLSYWDKAWFEKLSERVRTKHADLFP